MLTKTTIKCIYVDSQNIFFPFLFCIKKKKAKKKTPGFSKKNGDPFKAMSKKRDSRVTAFLY